MKWGLMIGIILIGISSGMIIEGEKRRAPVEGLPFCEAIGQMNREKEYVGLRGEVRDIDRWNRTVVVRGATCDAVLSYKGDWHLESGKQIQFSMKGGEIKEVSGLSNIINGLIRVRKDSFRNVQGGLKSVQYENTQITFTRSQYGIIEGEYGIYEVWFEENTGKVTDIRWVSGGGRNWVEFFLVLVFLWVPAGVVSIVVLAGFLYSLTD